MWFGGGGVTAKLLFSCKDGPKQGLKHAGAWSLRARRETRGNLQSELLQVGLLTL